jgi:hypothetical protein
MTKATVGVATAVMALMMSAYSAGAYAQLGSLGKLGGAKSESSDAKSEAPSASEVEAGLRIVVEQTSSGQAKLARALGLTQDADKLKQNAECTKAKTCSLADSVGVTQGANDTLTKAMKDQQAAGTKLSADSSKTALSAIEEVIGTIVGWQTTAKGAQGLLDQGAMAMMKLGDLGKAVPKVPGALKGTGSFAKDGIAFLTYNGVDTKALSNKMPKM